MLHSFWHDLMKRIHSCENKRNHLKKNSKRYNWGKRFEIEYHLFVFHRVRLQSRSQSFVPLDQRSENEALGATISGMRNRCRLGSEPDNQNSVISFVISKWLLPELSFSDSWSRGTKLWERVWRDSLSRDCAIRTGNHFKGTLLPLILSMILKCQKHLSIFGSWTIIAAGER